MSLSALIKKGGLRSIATATPAAFATDAPQQRPSVASVATVAVATAQGKAAKDSSHAQDFDGGMSDTQADVLALADDPDRHSWPHTTAMNTAEIDTLNARVQVFIQRGIGVAEAEGLADGLVIRDRAGDSRRLCLECLHLSGRGTTWSCNQWRAASLAGASVPDSWSTLPQRCAGFKNVNSSEFL